MVVGVGPLSEPAQRLKTWGIQLRRDPIQQTFNTKGAVISYFSWQGSQNLPTILLLHATGFHARVWDETIRALPADYPIIAAELRGHGRSSGTELISNWSEISDDVTELVDFLGLRGSIGVGHSLGGHCAVLTSLRRPSAFRELVLVDPVISEPFMYTIDRYKGMDGPHDHPIAKRRNRWDSLEEMEKYLREREPYSFWRRQVLKDYCTYGAVPDGDDGKVRLACAPVLEASVYYNHRRSSILDRLRDVEIPVTVIRARYSPFILGQRIDYQRSTTWEGLAAMFQAGTDVYLPHLSHFIPMQEPETVAGYIEQSIRRAVL